MSSFAVTPQIECSIFCTLFMIFFSDYASCSVSQVKRGSPSYRFCSDMSDKRWTFDLCGCCKGGQAGQTVTARPLGASQKCQGQTMNCQQADGGCAVTSLRVEGSPQLSWCCLASWNLIILLMKMDMCSSVWDHGDPEELF